MFVKQKCCKKIKIGRDFAPKRKYLQKSLAKSGKEVYNENDKDGERGKCMKRETIYQIFSHMPQLETERLILRPMCVSDAEDMYAYACREDVTAYLLWSPHPSLGYTRDYLSYIEDRYATGGFFDWAVVEKKSGRMIGTCGFTSIDAPNDVGEIGYVLNPDDSGRGYATEAAACVLRFGFETVGLYRIEAKFMKGNDASLRVMEKLGMHFEGYREGAMRVKGQYRTIGVCALLVHECR